MVMLCSYHYTANATIKKDKYESGLEFGNLNASKIYVHLDRSQYLIGEDIWFKAYLLNALTNAPDNSGQIVYVDLIGANATILATKIIKTENGSGHGDFKLKVDYVPGEYTLRAYTNYMRNFDETLYFKKNILVHSLNQISSSGSIDNANEIAPKESYNTPYQKPDLQFFPEGGDLTSGLVNRIAFKALGTDGKGMAIHGKIVDTSGNEILRFDSAHLGMGAFTFIPKAGEIYSAIVKVKKQQHTYQLPAVLNRGTILNTYERDTYYKIDIRSTLSNGINGFRLVAKQKKGVVYSAEIQGDKKEVLVNIPKSALETGIVQITLFDNKDHAICERLVFFNPDGIDPKVSATTSKKTYGKRELVTLQIQLDPSIENKRDANISISAGDISVNSPLYQHIDIKTYLLLNSELRGEIENPGYYFNPEVPESKKYLDLLMMTQGWRKFVAPTIVEARPKNLEFLPETGITLKGSVKSTYNHDIPAIAEVVLTYKNSLEMGQDVAKTDAGGNFMFTDLNFADTTTVLLQARSLNAKSKKGQKSAASRGSDFYLALDTIVPPKVIAKKNSEMAPVKEDEEVFLATARTLIGSSAGFSITDRTIVLEEAVLEADQKKKEGRFGVKRRASLYIRPSHTVDYTEVRKAPIGHALTALQGRVPGVRVTGDHVFMSGRAITHVGGAVPLFLLDGVPVDQLTIMTTPISDIDFVDVIQRGQAAIYGSAGVNGAIAVYTLKGNEGRQEERPKATEDTANFIHPGFTIHRKFYEPVYPGISPDKNKPDYRTTLCWKPTLQLGKNGKAKISFYAADVSTTYKVVLEGITPEGIPLSTTTYFKVK